MKTAALSDVMTRVVVWSLAASVVVFISMLMLAGVHF